jgi:hypothetical protein
MQFARRVILPVNAGRVTALAHAATTPDVVPTAPQQNATALTRARHRL